MESEACPFTVLPVHVCHSILTQAFQKLDQRHLLTITPLVCHLWHQLSLSACTSLEVEVGKPEAVEAAAAWMLKHGHRLLSLSVNVLWPDAVPLLEAIPAASQLRDLHLTTEYMFEECDFLQSLSSLTCLRIHSVQIAPDDMPALLALTQLRSLALTYTYELVDFNLIASSLVHLTSVEFSSSNIDLETSPGQLSALRSLTSLQQLRLGDEYVRSQCLAELDGLTVTAIGINLRTSGDITIASSWLRPRLADKLESIGLADFGEPPLSEGSELVRLLPAFSAAGPQFKDLNLFFDEFSPLLSHVSGLTQLTRLALRDGTVDQAALCQLSSLSCLQSLSLQGSRADASLAEDAVLGLIASLPQLTRLELADEIAMTPSMLQALGSRVISHLGYTLVLQQQE